MKSVKKLKFFLLLITWCLNGCAKNNSENVPVKLPTETAIKAETETISQTIVIQVPQEKQPTIQEVDWSGAFDGLIGAAVLYTPSNNQYTIYNAELGDTRRSPCSTFKIISSLIALEEGIISIDAPPHLWSGEKFWNEKWNQDIDFAQAFSTSCVWYYRQVIDQIGVERMASCLDQLSYGNGDISDWSGRLNNNNNNPALTGFWIESSLKISPKEQVEVLSRIFEENFTYSKESVDQLKQVMRAADQPESVSSVYGKTGMGKQSGVTVDAWYTGFVETEEGNTYFCVYLGENQGKDVSSGTAKEIAWRVLEDYL